MKRHDYVSTDLDDFVLVERDLERSDNCACLVFKKSHRK